MARMDERVKSEFNKINQEKFFLSVVIISIFLIFKISANLSALKMLAEISAGVVILIYLIPYFVIRHRYDTLDEMIRDKIYKLSRVFLIIEFFSLIPAVIVDTVISINNLNDPAYTGSYNFLSSPILFVVTLGIIVNIHGLKRMYNEKFVSHKAVASTLKNYKRKLLITAIAVTILMIAAIVVTALISNHFSAVDGSSSWLVVLQSVTFISVLGIPTCWFMYFYFLGTRKKLESSLVENEEEKQFLGANDTKYNP